MTVEPLVEVVERLGGTCDVWIASGSGGMRVLLADGEDKATALSLAMARLGKLSLAIENEFLETPLGRS